MNKRTILLAIAFLLIALLLIPLTGSNPERDSSATDDHTKLSGDHAKAHGSQSPRQGGNTSGTGLHQSASNSTPSTYSSTVEATLMPGETLVMGGYRTPDGKHEFTMLTPSLIDPGDGSQQIRITYRTLAVSPDFAREQGMDTLTTRYPTADQHAEAWSAEDLRSSLLSASRSEGVEAMTLPTLLAIPGHEATMHIGTQNGSSFTIKATIHPTDDGGFSIQSRVERRTGESP